MMGVGAGTGKNNNDRSRGGYRKERRYETERESWMIAEGHGDYQEVGNA